MSIATYIKDPQAVLSYSIHWADKVAVTNVVGDDGWLQGDTIASSSWAITGPDALLIQDSDSNSATIATVILSAGTANRNYTATNTITTVGGWTDERSITIQVRQR